MKESELNFAELGFEDKLAEEFPFMRQGKGLDEQHAEGFVGDLYGAFGCECGEGWYGVLRGLCRDITDAYTAKGLEVDVVPDQVKEKFGFLNFYHHIGHDYFNPPKHDMYKEVDALISKWEDISGGTCEWCGEPGTMRNDGWLQVRCDGCEEKYRKRWED